MTGPGLLAALEGDQWSDRKKLYAWVRNPAAYMKNDQYTSKLKEMYGSMMMAFPNLSDQDIDAIVDYITVSKLPQQVIAGM
jgi:cytochrome c1